SVTIDNDPNVSSTNGHVASTTCFKNCGDSSVFVDIHFASPDNTGVTLYAWWAVHLSSRFDPVFNNDTNPPAIGWGTGCPSGTTPCGSSSISGEPFHMRFECIDPDPVKGCQGGGGRDNQMSSGAVEAPGTITIIKDAVPNDPQDFAFTGNGGP